MDLELEGTFLCVQIDPFLLRVFSRRGLNRSCRSKLNLGPAGVKLNLVLGSNWVMLNPMMHFYSLVESHFYPNSRFNRYRPLLRQRFCCSKNATILSVQK